jgi:hypothetical protein
LPLHKRLWANRRHRPPDVALAPWRAFAKQPPMISHFCSAMLADGVVNKK